MTPRGYLNTAPPVRSREKMRCADFRVFSLRVQGLQPLPPTAQVILQMSTSVQRA
jgi:hypothetical protein